MKIIIEVEGGMVAGVYYSGKREAVPHVFVVDLDPAQIGESTKAEQWGPEPLRCASDITREEIKR